MLDYLAEYIRNWNRIEGRMDRHSYWAGLLTILVILTVLLWFGARIPVFNVAAAIFAILMILPWLTATIRRLHDREKRGWLILLLLIPVIGWHCLFIELILEPHGCCG